jgi:hypothetical protein
MLNEKLNKQMLRYENIINNSNSGFISISNSGNNFINKMKEKFYYNSLYNRTNESQLVNPEVLYIYL